VLKRCLSSNHDLFIFVHLLWLDLWKDYTLVSSLGLPGLVHHLMKWISYDSWFPYPGSTETMAKFASKRLARPRAGCRRRRAEHGQARFATVSSVASRACSYLMRKSPSLRCSLISERFGISPYLRGGNPSIEGLSPLLVNAFKINGCGRVLGQGLSR
jgi:hypothetical protein